MATRTDTLRLPAAAPVANDVGRPALAAGPAQLIDFGRSIPPPTPRLAVGRALPRAAADQFEALFVKRCLDLTVATAALLLLWPVMVAAAVLIRLSGPGPIFYSHQRLGRDGQVFPCLKFRTMRQDADRVLQQVLAASPELMAEWLAQRKLRNDPRILPVGAILRRYSIDELPQLLNVLCGDMSIVGPRPLATDEAHYYAGSFALYCLVKPGITGLWQVSGRNNVSYRRRVELDCHYVRTRCLKKDLRILFRTVPAVFGGTGY